MTKIIVLLLLTSLSFASQSKPLELLHWWSSKGELNALSYLESVMDRQHSGWESKSIVGSGGENAMYVLQARAIAGTPPEVAQIEGTDILSWAQLGFVNHLDNLAKTQDWQHTLRPLVTQINSFEGRYVSLPLTIHRTNWLWLNRAVFKKAHLTPPKTWSDLLVVISQLKSLGIQPIALGKDSWQISILFENIALGLGGSEYYHNALVGINADTINSAKTHEILSVFRSISLAINQDLTQSTWQQETDKLFQGEAAMQITGDWVIGELNVASEKTQNNIACFVAPQTQDNFVFNMDSLISLNGSQHFDQVEQLFKKLSQKKFLHDFNRLKGSIPPRNDIDVSDYNACSQKSNQDYNRSEENNTLLPSMTDSMAIDPRKQRLLVNEIYKFFVNTKMTEQAFISNVIAISKIE